MQTLREWNELRLPPPNANAERTLTGMLGANGGEVPRWRSLWRRTDYLGFPVYAFKGAGNSVDRGATEWAQTGYLWRIATHGDYLGTRQLNTARDELVTALGGRPDDRRHRMSVTHERRHADCQLRIGNGFEAR